MRRNGMVVMLGALMVAVATHGLAQDVPATENRDTAQRDTVRSSIWNALGPAEIKVGGEIGRRFNLTAAENFLALDLEEFLRPFQKKTGDPYIGIGKLIDAAVHFAMYCPDRALAKRVTDRKNQLVRDLIATQDADGYIGCKTKADRMRKEYDLHEHGYIVLGLANNYRHFRDDASLAAARKAADYTIQHWPGKGFTTLGVPEGLVALSEVSGKPKYAKFAEKTGMGRGVGVPVRQWAIGPGKGRGWDDNHVYRWLERCLMQEKLYERDPDPALLKQARLLEQFLLNEDGMVVTGTASMAERWHRDQRGTKKLGESCATAYLIRVLDQLARVTGEFRHADVMERSIYNALFAAQSSSGRKIRYYTPFEVPRGYSKVDTFCCPNNFRRIIADLPRMIYYRTGDAVAVSLYTASTADLKLKGGRVTIRQETDYPNSGSVTIHVQTDRPMEIPIHLRIPRWCTQANARINDGPPQTAAGGTVMELKRAWGKSDRISLEMPMSWRWVKGRKAQAGRAVLMRGPLVFCLSRKRNPALGKANLAAITLDPGSVDGPFLDKAIRPDGMAVNVKGWSPGRKLAEAPDLDLLLTEFPDPNGEAIYFRLSDDKRVVDDELIAAD